jgi:hypothetical protein
MGVSKERRDEYSRLRDGGHPDIKLDLFIDDAHIEMLWRGIKDGDLEQGRALWGYTDFKRGVHEFDVTIDKYRGPRITYQIDDLKKTKTRQELIDLTNLVLIQEKIAGGAE